MHGLIHDLRSAVRALLRTPGFLAVAVATLGIAMAANAAMFAFLNAVFFRPLPYASPEELFHLRIDPVPGVSGFERPRLTLIRETLQGRAVVAAYEERAFVVAATGISGRDASPELVQGARADIDLAAVVGVAPALGRAFDEADVTSGAAPTVIVADAFWRSHLDSRSDVIGAMVRIDGVEHSIIGVMPPGFAFPDFAEFWVPLVREGVAVGDVSALVRLDPGDRAQTVSLLERAIEQGSGRAQVRFVSILPGGGSLLAAILGAIGFVLLIACSNVANLVLARGTARRHEMGVRVALGATRFVLLRYLTFEGAMIAGAAALTGAIASTWLIELLVAAIPADGLPLWFDPRIDATVILYVVGIAAVATVLSAAAPGFTVTRGALASTLNAAGARSAGDAAAARMRAGLVAAQIALATVLLSGAGLLLRALSAQRTVDPGYAADAVVEIPTVRAFATDDERFAIEAIDRLAGIAGIDAAAAASSVALAGRAFSPANEAAALSVTGEAISASWIATMGLPLIAGRAFASGESGRDVVILSELVARTLFGTASDAVAATLRFEGEEASRARTVVGVVGDRYAARPGGLDGATPTAHAYVPLGEGRTTAIRFIVRVDAGDPLRLAPAATSVLRDIDRDAVIRTPRLLGDVERVQAGDLQFFSWIFNGFGAVALALASIGCWGVVAYSVTRRRKEIGLRIALGASTTRVVREIAGGMARPLGLGLVLGAAGALGLGQLLRGVLFAVAPMDPLTLAAVTLTFAAITGLAAWLPARRAARVDPMRTLRAD